MAPTKEELQARLRGLGSGFTKRIDQLKRSVEMATAVQTDHNLQKVRDQEKRCQDSFDDMEQVILELDIIDSAGSAARGITQATHLKSLIEAEKLAQNVEKQAIPLAPVSRPSNATAGNATPGVPRSNDFLKPQTLESDDKPSVLRQWKKAFTAYYKQHRMDLMSPDEQQLYFSHCLSKKLFSRIENDIKATTPILPVEHKPDEEEPPSCFKLLDEDFLRTYPLVKRRRDAFELKQQPGQKYSDMSVKLRELAVEGELQNLNFDSLLTYLHMVATNDPYLRNKFFRVEEPTLAKLSDIADAYESAEVGMSGLDSTMHVNALQQPKPIAHNTKCWRCRGMFRSPHDPDSCKFKTASCHNCNEVGHIKPGCPKPRRPEPGGASSGNSSTTNPTRVAKVSSVHALVAQAAPSPEVAEPRELGDFF